MQYTINIPEHLIPTLESAVASLKPRGVPPEEFLGNICTGWLAERFKGELVQELSSQTTEKLVEVRDIIREPIETIVEAKAQIQVAKEARAQALAEVLQEPVAIVEPVVEEPIISQ